METTLHFVTQWVEARTRFSNQLKTLHSEDLSKHLGESPNSVWSEVITTKEFGTKTKAEALGRIVSHTAYHAGQIALINKYGKGI